MTVLSSILSLTLFILSAIHIYWAFGGKSGFDVSLPSQPNGDKLFVPGFLECIIVAAGLMFFSYLYAANGGWFSNVLPDWVFAYGSWIIPSIFLIRAIGDFKYVGFFKKIKDTSFAAWDSKLYSPLCLFMAMVGFGIQFLK